jgi:phage terminase large subunit GpA-like protein
MIADATMHANIDAAERRIVAAWRPPPRLSLADWADKNFVLPLGDANAGRWRTIPYQRGIMDAITDPAIERISVMKSARVGWTKIMDIATGYFIHHDPCPILDVQPTIDDALKHSKEDIAPMLRDVPVLQGLVAEPRSRDSGNTLLVKEFRGGSLLLVGANSPRGFRRTSRRVIKFDEVDGYPPSAGSEGDPISLGIMRSEYYWDRTIMAGSTPTIAGYSRIETLFLEGDQRRYYVPCPECGDFQVLYFENLKWPAGRPAEAHFICVHNGCVIEHRHKRDMVEGALESQRAGGGGGWIAEAPEHFTPENRHASFHIWAAYSYSPNATWAQLAAEWLKADLGGHETRKTYVNTVRGETWKDRGEAPAWEPLMQRREKYRIGHVPLGALILTTGVDVQKDRLVYEVVGWGRGKTSWSIDYGILPGDTSDIEGGPWAQLDALLARSFPHAGGTELAIRMLAVDSGYNTQTVYSWARKKPMSRVIAIKGVEAGGVLIGAPSPVEVNDRGRKLKRGYKVWPVCGHVAKSELYGFLRLEPPTDQTTPPPPGFCHFPEYEDEFFKEMTAEQLVPVKTARGYVRLEWSLIPNRQNHALDCRVYARAAAAVVGLDRFGESDWAALEISVGQEPTPPPPPPPAARTPSPPAPGAPPPQRQSWLGPRRHGWVR